MTDQLEALVSLLPEVYQPIWGRPDLSRGRSRGSEDRLQHLLQANEKISQFLGRSLRVLDLGCAQGYFSHALSAAGAQVHGVDYLAENIKVCEEIAKIRDDKTIRFTCCKIEEIIESLESNEYDLVIGLSVFHHLIQGNGVDYVKRQIRILSEKSTCCIFEFATSNEPVHWAKHQPQDVRELLESFSYFILLAEHTTHLSELNRPLYFASSRIFYAGDTVFKFSRWTTASNALVPDSRSGKRRFYFTENEIIKFYQLTSSGETDLELNEWTNEIAFLSTKESYPLRPTLYASGRTDQAAWLIRDCYEGTTLDVFIQQKIPYDPVRVFKDILGYLCALESTGLFHNDVRAWNTLVKKDGSATLIDYGAISQIREDCTWPKELILSFLVFCHEIFAGKLEFPVPVRSVWMNPDRLPYPYGQAFWKVLSLPATEWNYTNLSKAVDDADTKLNPNDEMRLPVSSVSLLIERYEEAATGLRAHLSWLEAQSQLMATQSADELMQKESWVKTLERKRMLLEDNVAERDGQIAKLSGELMAKNHEAEEIRDKMKVLKNELDSIISSKRWRVISFIAAAFRAVLSK
jgi:O-antigen chain-terminating methyltransferase